MKRLVISIVFLMTVTLLILTISCNDEQIAATETPTPMGTPTPVLITTPTTAVTLKALAEHWAPVWYQDAAAGNYRGDYITKFNFDGNWNGADNEENLEISAGNNWKYQLEPYIYYWVAETDTHWFVGYADFHPKDWKPLGGHENDMEGCLLVVDKDGSEYGDLYRLVTQAHGIIWKYDSADVQYWENTQHPILYIEAQGHGVWARKYDAYLFSPWVSWDEGVEFPDNDGVVYYWPGYKEFREPNLAQANLKDVVSYRLIPIDDAIEGLWNRQYQQDTFRAYGTFQCDSTESECRANAPWGWDDGPQYPQPLFFCDPAYLSGATIYNYFHNICLEPIGTSTLMLTPGSTSTIAP
jgi:hypothetical protein